MVTEARLKKKQNSQTASNGPISTHPSYTEYSWDSIAGTSSAKRPSAVSGIYNPALNKIGTVGNSGTNTAATSKTAKKQTSKARVNIFAFPKAKAKTEVKVRHKHIEKIHTLVAEKRYSFPLSIVSIAFCFTILIMAIITTSVQITEITAQNSLLERQYNSMISEENELRLRLETRDDLRVVERLAKEEYGMVKKDQVERYYITVNKQDKIEIIEEVEEETSGIFDGILSFGGSIVERVRGFFGN